MEPPTPAWRSQLAHQGTNEYPSHVATQISRCDVLNRQIAKNISSTIGTLSPGREQL